MAPKPRGAFVILLCTLSGERQGTWRHLSFPLGTALAQEETAPLADVEIPGVQESGDALEASPEAAEGESADLEGDPMSFLDSAKELQGKLAQLKALLEKKGDSIDPTLKERLGGLTEQLSALGLDGLGKGSDGKPAADGAAVQDVLAACLALAVKSAGARRSTTSSTMGRLASGQMTPQEGSQLELVRLTTVCLNSLSGTELQQFRDGKLAVLPKALVDKAATKSAESEVLALGNQVPGIWEQLAIVAQPLFDLLQKSSASEAEGWQRLMYGMLAALVVVFILGVLGKRILDLRHEQRQKEELRREKAARKKK